MAWRIKTKQEFKDTGGLNEKGIPYGWNSVGGMDFLYGVEFPDYFSPNSDNPSQTYDIYGDLDANGKIDLGGHTWGIWRRDMIEDEPDLEF